MRIKTLVAKFLLSLSVSFQKFFHEGKLELVSYSLSFLSWDEIFLGILHRSRLQTSSLPKKVPYSQVSFSPARGIHFLLLSLLLSVVVVSLFLFQDSPDFCVYVVISCFIEIALALLPRRPSLFCLLKVVDLFSFDFLLLGRSFFLISYWRINSKHKRLQTHGEKALFK